MSTNVLSGWDNFLVAELGAAAALAGLLFVAVSINLTRILEFKNLPARAIEALMAFVGVLVVTTLALVPDLSIRAYGYEIGAAGLCVWAIQTWTLIAAARPAAPQPRMVLRILMNQLPAVPFVVAGVLLITGHPMGVYWLVPGVLLSFAAGILGAWVLLVEIQR
jgi:hypothetical protein